MFTAIVLVCAGELKTPENCYIYTNEVLFDSRKVCEQIISESVSGGVFTWYDESINQKHEVKDYYCVNWNAERI